jgi:hypothetical protein
MLRDGLASIRQQTAKSSIARVVVSENSVSDESEAVCKDFADLPLVYVKQRPPISALSHLGAIWHLVESPLVAILHDDDWWAPRHIESATSAMQSNARCVATYSSFLESYGPQSCGWCNHCASLSWLATGCDFSQPLALLDPVGVMLACLLNAAFHYSTVVGRKEAMWDAYSHNLSRGNAFDNDRTFPVFLSRHGLVGYVTVPEVFVRQHPFRDAWRPEVLRIGHMALARETTRWLQEHYPDQVASAAEKFKVLAMKMSPQEAERVWCMLSDCVWEPQRSTLIKKCNVNFNALAARRPCGLLPRWAFTAMKELCPPVLWRATGRIRMLGGWEQYVRRWRKEVARAPTKK